MKTTLLIAALVLPLCGVEAQTNLVPPQKQEPDGVERQKKDRDGYGKRKDRRREMTPEMREQMEERRLQLMQKTLNEIGVTDEQKAEITAIQAKMKADLKANDEVVDTARDHLSNLQREGATQEVLFVAIDELSAAQGEKLKILVRSQMDMKKVLGEEKYRLFMDSARSQWREHGRRGGGSSMPPRPGLPPIPAQGRDKTAPPPPMPNE